MQARADSEVRVEVHLAENSDDAVPLWRYMIGFKAEGTAAQRILVTAEKVFHGNDRMPILDRPDGEDNRDSARKTETHLEHVQSNAAFRDIADFFSSVLYLHIVPQLLKYADQFRGLMLEGDPFGQGLLEHIARTPERTRTARLKRIEEALRLAIPQFQELKFVPDKFNGQPHLEVRYQYHRPKAGWHREDQWSDGTLRLFGLLWSLLDGNGLLLLEEPELSLNDSVVKQIPALLQRLQRDSKRRRQVILSTHSFALLDNAIDGKSILRLETGDEGTSIVPPSEIEKQALRSGMTPAEVILPKTRPGRADQLRLF